MNTRHRSLPTLAAAATLTLLLAGCAGGDDTIETSDQPIEEQESAADCESSTVDCQDTVDESGDQSLEEQAIDDGEPTGGGAAESCLAGDADCIDESNAGGDVTRIVLIAPERSGAPAIERGATVGATGRFITRGHIVDDTTLELTFEGGSCDLVEDVLVTESDTEVRVLVLSAQDASVEMCTAEVTQWSTTVDLLAPLGDRTLLDLAG